MNPEPFTMRNLILELLGYAWVSAVALGVDVSLLRALVTGAQMHYLPASALAFCAGATVAYLLSVRFVFRFHQLRSRTWEFASFLGLGVAGLLVNTAALFVAVSGVGLSLLAAKALAAGCTFATNFTLRRQFLFAPPRTP